MPMLPLSTVAMRARVSGACLLIAALLAPLASAPAAPSGEAKGARMLYDFDKGFEVERVTKRDVTLRLVKRGAGSALRIASGHAQEWPGIDLPAPEGHWDLSRYEYLALEVRNVGENPVTVCCRVDNPGADGMRHCSTGSITLGPGEAGTLKVPFPPLVSPARAGKLFGMRGYPPGWGTPGTLDPTNVTNLVVFVPNPSENHLFEIDHVRAAGTNPPPEGPADVAAFFPWIDSFGQYRHRDWPGKVRSEAELKRRLASEQAELRRRPGPQDWNRYGGWEAGPKLAATGFFRVEKYQGKWWLVDPEGRLFFSHGIDCVGMLDVTPIEEREGWFEEFPGDRPEFQEFVVPQAYALHGHYAGRSPKCFGFAGANLKRKYGADWKDAAAAMAHRRLRSWGLNTIGNWSNESVTRLRQTPYVATIHFGGKELEGSEGYWGKFRDVFDPSFRAEIRKQMAAEVGRTAGDPWCLGYFVDNEIAWGDEVSLAEAALKSPAEQAAKRAFLDDLRAKYTTIEKLNAAWGTAHPSWEALLAHRGAPDRQRAWDDLTAFYARTAETYFRVIRDAVKEVAPNQLYLGCRFAWVNARAVAAAAKFCDVVSYNLYRTSVADFRLPIEADVPLIIGEFHFGALDRGMLHTGLVPVKSQAERAAAYKAYVRGALRHPQFVGCHWFQWQDEPTTGRVYDEENYQIGFVDITDTPYRETVAAAREVGYKMYPYRLQE
ncbi:MAG: beta-agarase [Armatimonadetes bacterium]|nr:beta-agarase [Armatimonadota bacterium]